MDKYEELKSEVTAMNDFIEEHFFPCRPYTYNAGFWSGALYVLKPLMEAIERMDSNEN